MKPCTRAKYGSWIQVYFKALESGMLREAAYRAAGVVRQSVWDWKRSHPGFAWDEQMARDRGSVEKLIRKMDAEEAPPPDRVLRDREYQREGSRRLREWEPERVREQQRRWRSSLGSARRERLRIKDRERRRAKRMETALPCRCEQCDATWLPVDGRRKGRFCSRKCANRWHGPRRTDRNRGVRNMRIGSVVLEVLASEPWLTRAEILERALDLKPGSLATKLCTWVKEGVLVRRGRRYATPMALDAEEAA